MAACSSTRRRSSAPSTTICARNGTEYLEQTENHVEVLTAACEALGLDPGEMTPGCKVVQHIGKALVVAMKMALAEAIARPPSWSRASAWCSPKPRITPTGS